MQVPDNSEILRRWQDASRLAAKMSHDFGNYLTGIIGFTDLSIRLLPPTSTVAGYLREVKLISHNGSEFTQQLRRLAESGMIQPGPTPLLPIMKAEVERLRTLFPAPISLRLDPEAIDCRVRIDPTALRNCLGQVLLNACESLPGKGEVLIQWEISSAGSSQNSGEFFGTIPTQPYVLIRIRDNGTGIALQNRQKILREPFFSTRPRHAGVGLGIVLRNLVASGGALQLESASGGCAVCLLIPTIAEV